MHLKAVLFDFNGVIIKDERIHRQLIDDIMLSENLRPQPQQYRQVCLGRSDRACLKDLLQHCGRFVSEPYLNQLIKGKERAYFQKLGEMSKLPIYLGLEDFITKLRLTNLFVGVVSGALRSEIEFVLDRINLKSHFQVIVGGDEIETSKPHPEGYLLAVDRLNQLYPEANLHPQECLVIEDTPAGIAAAKAAQMQVAAVANTYPFHMLQRQANWTVDYLADIEIERVQQVYTSKVAI
ncbi:HAD family hydrolase [Merismopedia glauca]|uniref:HAD family phosphatase n=1 Tax=Merismopedia glauca CCAP 1448/3 TaxID=1296344 RepID=A0A2T1BZF0_9CYAN|nr:HAD family phosphatase [Merismopedia glauca]PSB01288.1 HAD family phosphatase [Merismopedia glauca CCAP 1448/3]